MPCVAPGIAVFGEELEVLLSVLLQGCSCPTSPAGHDPKAVCLFHAAALAPPVSGSSPHHPSVESVIHSDPYQHVITVVKVSINRISSCPNLLASSAVLFLTEKHVDAKQK